MARAISPRAVSALICITALALAACGGEDSADCSDEPSPSTQALPDTALRRAGLRFERQQLYEIDGSKTVESVVTLTLVDLSKVRTDQRPPERLVGSESCVFLSGAPSTNNCRDPKDTPPCVPERLDADAVKVSGVPGGVSLDKQATGNYVNAKAPDPLFGSEELSIELTGKSDSGFFPSYKQTVAAPRPLELTSPTNGQPAPLGDVEVKWSNGGSADYVEISLRTDRQGDTDAIICVARDDGCHTLPAVAFDRLLLGMAPDDNFELTIKRINVSVNEIVAGTAAEARAIERVVIKLKQ